MILDFSKLTNKNCKISYKQYNNYVPVEENQIFILAEPNLTKNISIKIEIIDIAYNAELVGQLSLILSIV